MEWVLSDNAVAYEEAVKRMEARVLAIHENREDELIWGLEHSSLYTAGTSAKEEDLIGHDFPVHQTGRGGQYTYHGPGQRIFYIMCNLKKRQQVPDIKKYIWSLEEWIILTLKEFNILGERREGRIGIWVKTPEGEKKIAAIGVRIRHWVTYHGLSINVNPDLSHFEGIVPCGIKEFGVTSCYDLGQKMTMQELDEAMKSTIHKIPLLSDI